MSTRRLRSRYMFGSKVKNLCTVRHKGKSFFIRLFLMVVYLKILQDSEDLFSTTEPFVPKSRPLPGNHGDHDGSPLREDNREENEEGHVSGLINSDGEEEDWRPALISMSPL